MSEYEGKKGVSTVNLLLIRCGHLKHLIYIKDIISFLKRGKKFFIIFEFLFIMIYLVTTSESLKRQDRCEKCLIFTSRSGAKMETHQALHCGGSVREVLPGEADAHMKPPTMHKTNSPVLRCFADFGEFLLKKIKIKNLSSTTHFDRNGGHHNRQIV